MMQVVEIDSIFSNHSKKFIVSLNIEHFHSFLQKYALSVLRLTVTCKIHKTDCFAH